MVKFNRLSISPDHKILEVDAQVKELEYYENVTISAIYIDTMETYNANGPSDNYVYKKEFTDTDYTDETKKRVVISININEVMAPSTTYSDNMYFVYIVTTGNPTLDCPCGEDSPYTLGVVIDDNSIFNQMMCAIREVMNDCEIPKHYVNLMLLYKAVEMSIKTNNIEYAMKYFKKLKGINGNGYVSKQKCNCHG